MRAVSLRGHKYLCWVILVLAIGSSTASAATVLRASRGGCDISLEGPIAVGDKSTLTSILAQLEPQKNVWLCLHSPGGNYNEALGIIETMLAVEKGIATRVEANRECLSACALVFLAGNRGKSKDDELQPARELDAKGVLGFHGPYVKPGPLPPDPTIPAEAFRAGLRAIGRLLQISSEKMFPSDLLIGALEKGPSEFLYVDTIAKTGEWSVDFVGYRKPANLTARMLQVACTNDTNWRVGIENSGQITSKSRAPIQLKGGRFRGVYKGFGDEGTFPCVADVYRDRNGELYIGLALGDPADKTDKDVPDARALEKAVESMTKGGPRPGKPLWYVYPNSTKLRQIAHER